MSTVMITSVALVYLATLGAAPAAKPPAAPNTGKSSRPPASSAPRSNAPPSNTTPPPSTTTGVSETPANAPSTADDTGESSVTRYQFTGLDIDGELRTPALLQFLARIGGEFETIGIPHRSFMPELRRTVAEDVL